MNHSPWTFCDQCSHYIPQSSCNHNSQTFVNKNTASLKSNIKFEKGIFLHSTVMKLLDIRIGDLVLIENCNILMNAYLLEKNDKIDIACLPPIIGNDKFVTITKSQSGLKVVKDQAHRIAYCHNQQDNIDTLQCFVNRTVCRNVFIEPSSHLNIELLGKCYSITFAEGIESLALNKCYIQYNRWYIRSNKLEKTQMINVDFKFLKVQSCLIRPLLECDQQIKSVLVHGPSGCGKSMFCKLVADNIAPLPVSYSKNLQISEISFDSVLLIIDPLPSHMNEQYITQLKELFERIPILATCTSLYDVHSSLRRFDRFGIEIELPLPDGQSRMSFLRSHMSDIVDCQNLTRSFSYADLYGLLEKANSVEQLLMIAQSERPSVVKHIECEIPSVRWSDVGGMEQVKQQLNEVVMWPFTRKNDLLKMGVRPPTGVLLYGPPGCSKTLLCRVLAGEANLNFISIKGPELFSKWVGESERAVRELFARARAARPCIIFFDEIDSIGTKRGTDSGVADRVLTQLLTEMDGLEGLNSNLDPIVLVAATNRPDVIDPALLRPGRLDKLIHVPLPDETTRLNILRIHLRKIDVIDKENVICDMSKATEGYSGAELYALCQEAAMCALRYNRQQVQRIDVEQSLNVIRPRALCGQLCDYEEFERSITN